MIVEVDTIPVQIIRKSVKRMTLRVYPADGSVKLTVPQHCSIKTAEAFLNAKKQWIASTQERLRNRPLPPPSRFQTGAMVPFLGRTYVLNCIHHDGPCGVKIVDHLLHCYSKPESTEACIEEQIKQWYRRQLQELIPELIKKWEPVIGVSVHDWGIKAMKTRWGSCNVRTHKVWLNLALIEKPIQAIEYVVVHELVHLLEPSHNARFHGLMTQFLPDWKTRANLLK